MHCNEARRLLSLGMQPGAADPVRTALGFHLSSCSACRTYRTQLHNQQLLSTLFTEEPPPVHVPAKAGASFSSRATKGFRAAGTALLVGGLLALSPFMEEAPARAAETHPTPSGTQHSRQALKVNRIARHVANSTVRVAPAVAPEAAAAPASAVASEAAAAPEGIESATLPAGTELVIPGVAHLPEQTAAAPVGHAVALATYVVQPGDTLSGIALRYYGNAGLWNLIYDANQGVIGRNPGLIYPGQRLTIPVAAENPSGEIPIVNPPGFYIVRSGDTLSSIALRHYGDANLWQTIYDANRGVIGPNHNLIYSGQKLVLPAAPPVRQAAVIVQPAVNPVPTGGYQVQSGDTLSAIAQRVYGNPTMWPVIYEANRGVISNPNLIFPGQQLTIPAIY